MRPAVKTFLIGVVSVIVVASVIFVMATAVRYIAKESLPKAEQSQQR